MSDVAIDAFFLALHHELDRLLSNKADVWMKPDGAIDIFYKNKDVIRIVPHNGYMDMDDARIWFLIKDDAYNMDIPIRLTDCYLMSRFIVNYSYGYGLIQKDTGDVT